MLLTSLLIATSVSASVLDVLAGRQTNPEEEYLQEVCFPNTTSPVVPPCQSIINIQNECAPNGTAPLALLAHAECMCGGSFFADWVGCLDCDYVHGARSPQIVSEFEIILSSASNELCTGTPTASFAAIFSSLSDGVVLMGSDTVTTDLYPSQTAISLYYTQTVVQGPGAITGAATAATTKSVVSTSTSGMKTGSTSGTATGTGITSSAKSTLSSTAGAAPTGVWFGAVGAIAGGAMIMAL